MLRGKRVFISGGNGVIGKALVETLDQEGAIIYVGDLKPRPYYWKPHILYRQGDLNYIAKGELQAFQPDYFFHLAAPLERSPESYELWDENYQHNIKLSHHLMDCLKDMASLKKVIFASSYLIYNPDLYNFIIPAEQAVRLSETMPIYPRNLCEAAKLLYEIELQFIGEFNTVGFETVCARIYRSYGKHSQDIISQWIRALLKDEIITVCAKEGLCDYVFADDVAEGLVRLAKSQATGIVNLGTGRARRVEEILTVLKRHFPNMKSNNIAVDSPFEAAQANMERFVGLTGWKPSRELEDTIPEMIQYEKTFQYGNEEQANFNILVTSISKKIPLLKALRKANLKIGNCGKIIGADVNGNSLGRYFVDVFWSMPRLADLKIQELLEYCKQNAVSCIIPTRDGELEYFAGYKDVLAQAGIAVMVPDLNTVTTCVDKQAFYENMSALGYPVIKTSPSLNEIAGNCFVVKERYGAGARMIGLNMTKEEALDRAALLDNAIFQPYIEGKEISIDLYVDRNGKTKGVVARSRDFVVNGESQETTTLSDRALEKLCAKFAEDLKLRGHAILQLFIDLKGQYHIIECNSRFGGASTLSIEVGLDSFYWFLLEAQGVDISEYPFARSPIERKQVRYAQDLLI